jgi:uroporphyrinogen III methyltransferase / synthase
MSGRVAPGLLGRRVAVTRATDQAAELFELLRARGAEPLACPTIQIAPPMDDYAALDAGLRALGTYDWVAFTSQNAVHSFADRIDALGVTMPETIRLAAVGDGTGRTVTRRLRAVDFIPSTARAESLATELGDVVGRRVFFPRGNLASETLARVLQSRGASVDEAIAYRTVLGAGARQLGNLVRSGDLDAILFMSASSVRQLFEVLAADGVAVELTAGHPAVVCVGPETARAARVAGIEVNAVATEQTVTGVVDALEQWFGREDNGKGR